MPHNLMKIGDCWLASANSSTYAICRNNEDSVNVIIIHSLPSAWESEVRS
jgi:hypothetical protein